MHHSEKRERERKNKEAGNRDRRKVKRAEREYEDMIDMNEF
jgi:hypothetical protein